MGPFRLGAFGWNVVKAFLPEEKEEGGTKVAGTDLVL